MERLLKVLLIGFFFFIIPNIIITQTSSENTPEETKEHIIQALEAGDFDQLTALVSAHQHLTYSMAMKLLDNSIQDEFEGHANLAQDKMAKAERLALLYDELFHEKYLLSRVNMYQDWTKAQKDMRIEIDSLKIQGKRDYKKSRYDEAGEKLNRALELSRVLKEKWSEACVLIMLGVKCWYQEEYDLVLEYYDQALAIMKEIGNKKDEGTISNNIGLAWWQLGDNFKALAYVEKALSIYREVGFRSAEANALTNMGIYSKNLGHFQKALSHYREALHMQKERGDLEAEALILGNMGIVYNCMGRYQEAIHYVIQALQMNREVGNRRREGLNTIELGEIYIILGQYRKAQEYLHQAYDSFEEIEYKKGLGMSLSDIGLAYWYMGNDDEALTHYERALSIHREIECASCEAENIAKIGDVYCKAGDYEKALEHYETAFILFKELGEAESEAESYCRIGNIYIQLGDYEAAIAQYGEALRMASEIDAPEVLWTAQRGIGRALEGRGKYDEALIHFEQAITTIESLREGLDIEPLKTHYLANKISVYQSLVRLLADRGRVEDAFEYSERAKARALLDVLSQGELNVSEGIDAKLIARKQELQRTLNRLNTLLTQAYLKEDQKRDQEHIDLLRDSLRVTRMSAEELQGVIELASPTNVNAAGISKPLSLAEIQENILSEDDNVVLVEYMVGEESSHVWVVKNRSFHYEKIEVTEAELSRMIKELRQPFVDFREGKIYLLMNVPYDMGLAAKLFRLIFQPVEKYLRDGNQLIIVPDGILHNLPFEALVSEYGVREIDSRAIFSQYEEVRYFVEKYPISYAPSVSVLDPHLRTRPEASEYQGRLLAFGNPNYGTVLQDSVQNMMSEISPTTLLLRSGEGWVFEQLPMAEREVYEISTIIDSPRSVVLTGVDAKEEVFKEKAGRYRHIHLATHSVYENKEPLYSRIIFALDDDPKEDGFLETHEIFDLRLNADLVVLSACETGLGELAAGEGLIGLTRAFMYAGAPSVVVSLWSVDESTCRLMKHFYQNLKDGMTKAEALRQAKIKLIHTSEEGMSYAHPFLWAPFVLVGRGD